MKRKGNQLKTFAVRMQKYIDKPFGEGAYGPDAYDCVGLIWTFLRDSGVKVPDNWNGLNADNYFHLARGSKKNEIATLIEWLKTLGIEIHPYEKIAGDIILVDVGIVQFPAIYCGNNHAIAAFRDKVRVFSLSDKIKSVLAIRVI